MFYNLVCYMSKLKKSDILLIETVNDLRDETSSLSIINTLTEVTERNHSTASLHHALKRLMDLGFIDSVKTEVTATRGDSRKRMFHVTAYGHKSINQELSIMNRSAATVDETKLA